MVKRNTVQSDRCYIYYLMFVYLWIRISMDYTALMWMWHFTDVDV